MTPATIRASVTGVSSTAKGSFSGRRTASRPCSPAIDGLARVRRQQRHVGVHGDGVDTGRFQFR
jgi:hypothetical protein